MNPLLNASEIAEPECIELTEDGAPCIKAVREE
jgi:hypothetical protein